MKTPSILEGAGVGLLVSLGGVMVFVGLTVIFGTGLFRLLITVLAFTYLTYLLLRSRHRVGRVSVMLGWVCITLIGWLFIPSSFAYLLLQLCLIWLVRALYYYHSVLAALLDLGLIGISLVAAIGTWQHTHSLFLSLWSFFLLQALFVLIPREFKRRANTQEALVDNSRFDHAHRAAQAAVRKLTSV